MGDEEHRQAQSVPQSQDQLVEGGGADRVQASGGLVEEKDVRVQCQGTGQRGALDHAPRQRGRVLVGGRDWQPGQGQLHSGQVLGIGAGQPGVLDQRQRHVFGDGQRREQRALLKQHAEASLDQGALLFAQAGQVLA